MQEVPSRDKRSAIIVYLLLASCAITVPLLTAAFPSWLAQPPTLRPPLWDSTPGYALRSFAGVSAFSVPQLFSQEDVDRLLSAEALQRARRWQAGAEKQEFLGESLERALSASITCPEDAAADASFAMSGSRFLWCGTASDPNGSHVNVNEQTSGTASVPGACQSARAQAFFNQGITQRYAFTDNEAACSFLAALQDDPNCTLAAFGFSLAIGPNVNYGYIASSYVYACILMAVLRTPSLGNDGGSARTYNALLVSGMQDALKKRYLPPGTESIARDALCALKHNDSGPLETLFSMYNKPNVTSTCNDRYASAMEKLHAQLPDDEMVALITVGALMQNPAWKWWQPGMDYPPRNWTRPSILDVSDGIMPNAAKANSILADVLRRNPASVGANHYYIHNVEANPQPFWAEAVADRLYQLNPTGHVQHMSAHVYTRVGLYNLSIYQNKLANLADFNWSLSRAGGLFLSPFYRYQSHDIQFQTDAALREFSWAEAAASLALQNALASFLVPADHTILANVGRINNQFMVPLRFGLYKEYLRDVDASPVDSNGYFKYAETENASVYSPSSLQMRVSCEASAAARAGDVNRSLSALSRLLNVTAQAAKPEEPLCDDPTATCVNASCSYYLARWQRQKDAVLDVHSADALGTTTIDNSDPLRCLYIRVPYADFLIAKGFFDAAVEELQAAVAVQETLQYDEPSPFPYPIIGTLGKVFIKIAQAKEQAEDRVEVAWADAAAAFRKGLFTYPREFGLVHGLYMALVGIGDGRHLAMDTLLKEVGRWNDTAFDLDFL